MRQLEQPWGGWHLSSLPVQGRDCTFAPGRMVTVSEGAKICAETAPATTRGIANALLLTLLNSALSDAKLMETSESPEILFVWLVFLILP